ncbi:hypothetical protein [Polaribacter sp. Q13]|uniref:hypothetical protein n=1 Tax=Polaribacter sp. Q13 TaxID=2806551 RepID=UPI00193BFD6D|nr:hypothetical protein [Polaribacter sp. Q13]QVY65847.1 hypothetical protein JOP69_00715 [Polaribacter sp. Q13]
MTSKLKNTTLSKKEKNKLRLAIVISVIAFFILKEIFTNWEHFKVGISGGF